MFDPQLARRLDPLAEELAHRVGTDYLATQRGPQA
jgi:hypothetical protein